MSDLIVRPDPDRETGFILVEPLLYFGKHDHFRIPAGFHTDFASIPRILWPLIPPQGRHAKAAVIHDWLYVNAPTTTTRWLGGRMERSISRREADGVFRRVMRESGVGWLRRWTMWLGVRLGGWAGWHQRRLDQKAGVRKDG